jgi:hypothetical protein
MTAGVGSALLGLLIVILAVGIPYYATHRHLRPQHDPAETRAYQRATARSSGQIAARKPGRAFRYAGRDAQNWRAAQAGVHPETGEPVLDMGDPGRPSGMG